MDNQKKSDLDMEFYKKGIEFLYKQAPVIVVCILFCVVMGYALKVLWEKNERTYAALEKRMDIYQHELQVCELRREELATQVAELTMKVTFLQTRGR